MKIKNHGLSIVFLFLFTASIVGQSVAGFLQYNEEQIMHNEKTISWLKFIGTADFVVDVAENWQSEYLQFFALIIATVWFVQKGSPESKKLTNIGTGGDKENQVGKYLEPNSPKMARRHGFAFFVYANSLLIVMGAIFILSWALQWLSGSIVHNQDLISHGMPPISLFDYFLSPNFWNRTLQNWQSEFLAVGTMIAFSIYLRQKGSPESKPVGAPHESSTAFPAS